MFTGIIEQVGKIESIDGNRFEISHTYDEPFELGESVALNGMCATVVETSFADSADSGESASSAPVVSTPPQKSALRSPLSRGRHSKKTFSVEIIYESRSITTFGSAKIGDLINLERAARVGQRNSGHNVTGHIDEIGVIQLIEPREDFWLLRISVLKKHRPLLVHKGSVALAGISLTISAVSDLKSDEAWFEVSIIPHTWAHTNLKNRVQYAGINVEFDVMGKYALNAQ